MTFRAVAAAGALLTLLAAPGAPDPRFPKGLAWSRPVTEVRTHVDHEIGAVISVTVATYRAEVATAAAPPKP